jgi:Asp-tRNA(Asn)/Glu-tRNA(Gln) amidotransferase A subunit family amidase
MVPVAFGTQTGGSIIRPASYCGVIGYKPSIHTINPAGVKPLAGASTRSASLPGVWTTARWSPCACRR